MSDELLHVDVQLAMDDPTVPPPAEWLRWASAAATAALNGARGPQKLTMGLTIRLVDQAESARLNATYRHKTGPTNVLAFAGTDAAPGVPDGEQELGDLVICLPLLHAEARAQGKDPVSHMAHLTVHGTLHLLGYDHADTRSAERMETLEAAVLALLGYPDPYAAHTP